MEDIISILHMHDLKKVTLQNLGLVNNIDFDKVLCENKSITYLDLSDNDFKKFPQIFTNRSITTFKCTIKSHIRGLLYQLEDNTTLRHIWLSTHHLHSIHKCKLYLQNDSRMYHFF